jgi:hypothetical protein
MEVLGTKAVRWPGETWGIDRMAGFQIVDDCYLEQDDYDEFIRDPSHFLMTKVWARRHEKLKGLAKLDFSQFVEFGHYAGMAPYADPEVREALITLMAAGDQAGKWLEGQGLMASTALEYQAPLGCILGQNAPYDMLGDNLRGLIELPMDLHECPDKVEAALEILTDWAIKGVENIAAAGMKYCLLNW